MRFFVLIVDAPQMILLFSCLLRTIPFTSVANRRDLTSLTLGVYLLNQSPPLNSSGSAASSKLKMAKKIAIFLRIS